eukprot:281556-Chlamydomonas_euryale.AAC.3
MGAQVMRLLECAPPTLPRCCRVAGLGLPEAAARSNLPPSRSRCKEHHQSRLECRGAQRLQPGCRGAQCLEPGRFCARVPGCLGAQRLEPGCLSAWVPNA